MNRFNGDRFGETCWRILRSQPGSARTASEHPETTFKQSVLYRSVNGYNGFSMTDQAAVDRAIHEGAIRLINPAFENPF